MFRHPLIRKSIDPMEVIKAIKESIDDYKLDNDQRLNIPLEKKTVVYFFLFCPYLKANSLKIPSII